MLEHNSLTMTYDSRSAYTPFSLDGTAENLDDLKGMILVMEREMVVAGISLRNTKQMNLLKWRPKKDKDDR